MSIFGWSLPPGCGSLPGEEDAGCEVCGTSVDACVCPECPTCGEAGNPRCYAKHPSHGMQMNRAQRLQREESNARELAQAEADRAEGEYWATHQLDDITKEA